MKNFSRTAVTAAITAALLIPATSATATPATDGFWYFDLLNIQAAHDAGFTGEGVTIAVVDSPINLEVPTLQAADIEVQDSVCYYPNGELISPTSTDLNISGHGTNIVSYLVGSGEGYPGQTGVKGIVPDAKVIYSIIGARDAEGEYQCTTEDSSGVVSPMAYAVDAAIEADADIISISATFAADSEFINAIARAMNRGIVVFAGVPNEFVGGGWPSRANGVVGVQSLDSSARPQNENFDPKIDILAPGVQVVWQGDSSWEEQRYARGTSLATPIAAGLLGLVAQKYPDATGNQLIQTLIHNTDDDPSTVLFDTENRYGYGAASATRMLRVDPSRYDDVNPLIVADDDAMPTAAEIAAASDEPTLDVDELEPQPAPEFVQYLPLIFGGALVGLLLLAGIITLIIVLVVRRGRNTSAR